MLQQQAPGYVSWGEEKPARRRRFWCARMCTQSSSIGPSHIDKRSIRLSAKPVRGGAMIDGHVHVIAGLAVCSRAADVLDDTPRHANTEARSKSHRPSFRLEIGSPDNSCWTCSVCVAAHSEQCFLLPFPRWRRSSLDALPIEAGSRAGSSRRFPPPVLRRSSRSTGNCQYKKRAGDSAPDNGANTLSRLTVFRLILLS